MTVSTVSNDYCLGNSSRIKYETIRNETKRKQLLGKAQSRQRENILGKKNRQSSRKGITQLIYSTITIAATKSYREKHNTINS